VLITEAHATSGLDAVRLAYRLRLLVSSARRSTIRRTAKKGFSCSSAITAATVRSKEAKPDAIVTSGPVSISPTTRCRCRLVYNLRGVLQSERPSSG